MRTARLTPGLAALAAFVLVIASDAQEKKPIAEKHDAQALVDSLRDVINTGAELFNKHGDYAGCYRVYQGGLLAVKPFLTPDLQQKIDRAIAKAEQTPRFSDRAFELRAVIDAIRAQGKGAPVAGKKEMNTVGPKKEGKMSAGMPTDPTVGQVSGKVTFEGKPAPPGFVTMVGKDKRRFSASITADGSYSFKTPIPAGRYRIAIERTPGAQIPAKLDIPDRYRAEGTSGLTVEVAPGKMTLDLDLAK